jgi:hypothetical protein
MSRTGFDDVGVDVVGSWWGGSDGGRWIDGSMGARLVPWVRCFCMRWMYVSPVCPVMFSERVLVAVTHHFGKYQKEGTSVASPGPGK